MNVGRLDGNFLKKKDVALFAKDAALEWLQVLGGLASEMLQISVSESEKQAQVV